MLLDEIDALTAKSGMLTLRGLVKRRG